MKKMSSDNKLKFKKMIVKEISEIEENAILPEHSHTYEQTTQIIEGKLEMTVGDKKMILEPGMIVHIPSEVKHSGKALTTCKLTDSFCPAREDLKFDY